MATSGRLKELAPLVAGAVVGAAIYLLLPAARSTVAWGAAATLLASCILLLPFLPTTKRVMERLPEKDRNSFGFVRAASRERLGLRLAATAAAALFFAMELAAGVGTAVALLYVAGRQSN